MKGSEIVRPILDNVIDARVPDLATAKHPPPPNLYNKIITMSLQFSSIAAMLAGAGTLSFHAISFSSIQVS